MFVDELRRAVETAPRSSLADLSRTLWKAYAQGLVGEGDAQNLAEAMEARKALPARVPQERVRTRRGSRPRSPESMERRRRWVASGRLPPQIAASFTMGEAAVLAVVASEAVRRGDCRLAIGHLAALAGVCATTVRNAIRTAEEHGLLRIDERRVTCWRNLPNVVTITSAEWRTWLRLRPPAGGGCNSVQRTGTSQEKRKWQSPFPNQLGASDEVRVKNRGQSPSGRLSR